MEIKIPKDLHKAFALLSELKEQVGVLALNIYVFAISVKLKFRDFGLFYEKALLESQTASTPATLDDIIPLEEREIQTCDPIPDVRQKLQNA